MNGMSAFDFYSKTFSSENCKRKNKKQLKKSSFKKPKIEKSHNGPKKSQHNVLNTIYNLNLKDSIKTGKKLLEWLIHPISIDDFMK